MKHAYQARSALTVFQVLCTSCMILGTLSALIDIPSVTAGVSTIIYGTRDVLEQLTPVALVTVLIAFLLHDDEGLNAYLMRSRFPAISMLRFFLTGNP